MGYFLNAGTQCCTTCQSGPCDPCASTCILYPPPGQNPDPADATPVSPRYPETDLPASLLVILASDGSALDTISPTYDGSYTMKGSTYQTAAETAESFTDWIGGQYAGDGRDGINHFNALGLVGGLFGNGGNEFYLADFFSDTYSVSGTTLTRNSLCTWLGGGRVMTYDSSVCKWTLDGVVKTSPQSSPAGVYGSENVS